MYGGVGGSSRQNDRFIDYCKDLAAEHVARVEGHFDVLPGLVMLRPEHVEGLALEYRPHGTVPRRTKQDAASAGENHRRRAQAPVAAEADADADHGVLWILNSDRRVPQPPQG